MRILTIILALAAFALAAEKPTEGLSDKPGEALETFKRREPRATPKPDRNRANTDGGVKIVTDGLILVRCNPEDAKKDQEDCVILVIKSDGTGLKKVMSMRGRGVQGMTISPQGRILFDATVPGTPKNASDLGQWEIFETDVNGKAVMQATSTGFSRTPVISPDGKKAVFFTQLRGSSYNSLHFLEGGEPRLREGGGRERADAGGEFSPDSSLFAFHSWPAGKWDDTGIWLIGADGKNPRQITQQAQSGESSWPTWSADGKMIAVRNVAKVGEWHIAVLNADGSGFKRIHGPSPMLSLPRWLGRRIVFAEIKREGSQMMSVNADGSDAKNVGPQVKAFAAIEPSPDGKRVLTIVEGSGGKRRLILMNADGSDAKVLMEREDLHGAIWAPAGK